MPRFGITSRILVDAWERLDHIRSYETRRFIAAAREVYGEVVLLNPSLVGIELPRRGGAPRIFHAGAELAPLDALLLRGTKGLGDGATGLVRALRAQGCDVLDPAESFEENGGSKLGSSFDRHAAHVGSETYLAFGRDAAVQLVERLAAEGKLPLVGKPIAGRKGRGVTALCSVEEALAYVDALYTEAPGTTALLQRLERFVAEYRVMLFFGTSLGIARKVSAPEKLAANAAQGGTYMPSDRADVVAFAQQAIKPVSFVGADVGETEAGDLVIIEANHAPLFSAFDAALGCDTARLVVELARRRLAPAT